MFLCVCKLLLYIYIYIYIYKCFIEKEFSYNENGKFQYIEYLIRKKNDNLKKVAQSAGGILQ